MYRTAGRLGLKALLMCVLCLALALAMPCAAQVGSVVLKGSVLGAVRISVSTTEVQWSDLVPGENCMENAFQVFLHSNTEFNLSIHASKSHMTNGNGDHLGSPLKYRLDDDLDYTALPEQPQVVRTYQDLGSLGTQLTVHLKQEVSFDDEVTSEPNSWYTTTIYFTAETTTP